MWKMKSVSLVENHVSLFVGWFHCHEVKSRTTKNKLGIIFIVYKPVLWSRALKERENSVKMWHYC